MFKIIICLAIFAMYSYAHAYVWSNHEKNLYQARKFIELEHELILKGQNALAGETLLQFDALVGCRAIHDGKGSIKQVIQCMDFINRQAKLGFSTSNTQSLKADINILCKKLVRQKEDIELMIEKNIFRPQFPFWHPCETYLWQQVYLTAYANFEASPIATLAFIRRAQLRLPYDKYWTLKTIRLSDGK
jgi:hypothetical protein